MPSFDDVSRLYELAKKGATLDAQEAIMALREAILELREENRQLKDQLVAIEKSPTVISAGVRWIKAPSSPEDYDANNGPFCPVCFGKDSGTIIPLSPHHVGYSLQDDSWGCPSCDKIWQLPMLPRTPRRRHDPILS